MEPFFRRALPYIEMGWLVFPTRVDKVPLCPHGRNDATCESLTIEAWSDKFPQANVSIKTGEESGIAVIDIDTEEGERWVRDSKAGWSRQLPDTAEAKSGRGRHLYYGYLPVRSADGKIAPGVDIKAIGGSITAPISLHSSGRLYEWVRPPFGRRLPLLPLWIARALAPPPPRPHLSNYDGKPPSSEHLQKLLAQIATTPPGGRNHTLNRVSFIFGLIVKDGFMSEHDALNLLHQAGMAAGLDEHEVRSTVRSGLNSGLKTIKRR